MGIVFGALFGEMATTTDPTVALEQVGAVGSLIAAIVYVLLLWIGLAVSVKRCHDRNRTGWFVLLSFIPILNIWYLIEVGFLKGTTGPNTYGPDPLMVG